MAVSQQQKVDFLLKKLGFTKTKTGLAVDSTLTGTKKAGFGEESSSNGNNKILVRFKLTSGQSISTISFQAT